MKISDIPNKNRFVLRIPKKEKLFPSQLLENLLSVAEEVLYLDVIAEGLTLIPDEFEQLKNLHYISVGPSSLTMIPPFIFQLEKLRTLKLKNGLIADLPSFLPSSQLTHLELTKNRIKEIQSLGGFEKLEFLDLSGNQISSCPSDFAKLKLLKRLNLDNNKLSTMLDPITQLSSLQHLSLDGNPLSDTTKDQLFKRFGIWF